MKGATKGAYAPVSLFFLSYFRFEKKTLFWGFFSSRFSIKETKRREEPFSSQVLRFRGEKSAASSAIRQL
jgi:hypothetical protein